jgi:hypothetical protein
MKFSLIKKKDRSMMVIEDGLTMKINIMKLTINRISLKETATKGKTLREKSINKNSQVMNGTFSLPVNLCFGGLSVFCLKTSMNNGIFVS